MQTSADNINDRYQRILGHLNEKSKRLWCANEALSLGRGGILLVSKATKVSRTTIRKGVRELKNENILSEVKNIRKSGGGRKSNRDKDKGLISHMSAVIESSTRGDPESPLLWNSKSTRNIASALEGRISHVTVAKELSAMGYSLQANRKTMEGSNHPDRDNQFNFINNKTKIFLKKKYPVISVDTKKKELIGEFKNNGEEYRKKKSPVKVNVYDFIDQEKGKASPYGIYDLAKNKGWVSVGISADTAEFAVNSIRSWWNKMGKKIYSKADSIYINADGGGSNGSRVRLWKKELQNLANEMGKIIHVSHFPPGTSKWNKIEHKMFSFISKNWRGRPLIDTATIVSLIGNTKTKSGLKIIAELDEKQYQKGIKISDKELSMINLSREEFHGEWNYIISPNG